MAESQKVTRRSKQKLEEAIQKGLKDLVTNRGIYAVSVGNLVDYLTKRGFDEEGLIIQIKKKLKSKKVLVGKGRVDVQLLNVTLRLYLQLVSVSYLQCKIRPYSKRKRPLDAQKSLLSSNC